MTNKVEMKSNGGNSLSPILERHTPQHPLPDEIQKMETDETVCQFCGVSYLIHHEIKKLEDQVKALESELVQYRASWENERKLREELRKANASIHSLQTMLDEKDSTIDRMTHSIEGKQLKLDGLHKEKAKILNQHATLRQAMKKFKEDILHQSQTLMEELHNSKAELTSFKQAVKPVHSDFANFFAQVTKDMEKRCQEFDSEQKLMRQEIQVLQEELSSRIKNEDLLQNTIKLMQSELEAATNNKDDSLNEMREENEKLLSQVSSLETKNTEFSQDFATLKSQHCLLKTDYAQMTEALSKKHQEVQSAVERLHKTEMNAESTIQRMNQEIKHLEQDLVLLNTEQQNWKGVENSLRKQLEEQQRQMSTNSGESQQLLHSLQSAKQELMSLKNERERMVMSHQSQIAQLRESFKEKLNASNGNPKELEERLKAQKEMHEKELMEIELHLKENFDIEMALVKEKHEEEMRDYMMKHKEMDEQSKSDSKREIQQLSSALQILQTQISAMKSQHSQEMVEQEDEKAVLKRLITQLEEKITSLMSEQDGATIAVNVELRETKRKLQEMIDEKSQLSKQVDSLKEEVTMLQETVRRECEERFELTEALSAVRDQLVRSSKPNSPLVRAPVSAINGVPRQESFHDTKLSSKTLRSLENYNQMESPQSVLPDVLPRNVKRDSTEHRSTSNGNLSPHVNDISFAKQPSPPLGRTLPRTKSEDSVETVRRRIAAVIKRR